LHPSSDIIRIFKSRRIRGVGHVGYMEMRNAYRILIGKPEGKKETTYAKTQIRG
jgi:hypothetical protein